MPNLHINAYVVTWLRGYYIAMHGARVHAKPIFKICRDRTRGGLRD